jgi:transcriptional regulator with PAS, ATPase and Fis domain
MKTMNITNVIESLTKINKAVLYFDHHIQAEKPDHIILPANIDIADNINVFKRILSGKDKKIIIFDINKQLKEHLQIYKILKKYRSSHKKAIFILFSEYDDFQTVFDAYQAGINFFIPKFNLNLEYFDTVLELLIHDFNRIVITKNPILQSLYGLINFYAKKINTNILIVGETGTGKGILAQALYNLGNFKGKFISKNCGSIPDTLFESEMFGYKPGSFTGADKNGKEGYIEQAKNGLLFLDEISELPLEQQTKILNAVQNKKIQKIGYPDDIFVNLRYIFATNKELYPLVQEGNFREDLYYRFKGAEIVVPSLKETLEDIEIMVAAYCNRFLQEQYVGNKKINIILSENTINQLKTYSYPGNYRELQKIIYHSLIKMIYKEKTELTVEVPKDEKPLIQTKDKIQIEQIWMLISLIENGLIKYGGIENSIKRSVLDILRTKYNDNRKLISRLLQFKDKQSLSNEISRLNKI